LIVTASSLFSQFPFVVGNALFPHLHVAFRTLFGFHEVFCCIAQTWLTLFADALTPILRRHPGVRLEPLRTHSLR
jgi:hypothetical protein